LAKSPFLLRTVWRTGCPLRSLKHSRRSSLSRSRQGRSQRVCEPRTPCSTTPNCVRMPAARAHSSAGIWGTALSLIASISSREKVCMAAPLVNHGLSAPKEPRRTDRKRRSRGCWSRPRSESIRRCPQHRPESPPQRQIRHLCE
jgi:hypothetical protein